MGHRHAHRLAILGILALTGCGDELLGPEPRLILIQSPQGTVLTDGDMVAPGVQVDVDVRTTLPVGTAIELTARDAADLTVATATTTVLASGDATFAAVTLPNGNLT